MNTHDVLRDLVRRARCKPGWQFFLRREEDDALRLVIQLDGRDSDYPEAERHFIVNHIFPVPEATYNERSWCRWLFEMCRRVENHELGEWFRVGDRQPFRPLHGPGEDPYTVHEFRDHGDTEITQDGSVRRPVL